jgi:hypothetical protein
LQDFGISVVMERMQKRILASYVFVIALAALAGGCKAKPDLPISVSFRKAVIGPSLVAQIHNNSDTTIKVLVEASSQTTGTAKAADFVIGARGTREFGWGEGWQFVPGENIRIHNGDYADMTVKVP